MTSNPAQKFDPARAGEYEIQSRIALAGYDACHELTACMLAVTLGAGSAAQILVVGAGGGAREIATAGTLEPRWRFTAVDPSQPMMDISKLWRLSVPPAEHGGLIDHRDVPDLSSRASWRKAAAGAQPLRGIGYMPRDAAMSAAEISSSAALRSTRPLSKRSFSHADLIAEIDVGCCPAAT